MYKKKPQLKISICAGTYTVDGIHFFPAFIKDAIVYPIAVYAFESEEEATAFAVERIETLQTLLDSLFLLWGADKNNV